FTHFCSSFLCTHLSITVFYSLSLHDALPISKRCLSIFVGFGEQVFVARRACRNRALGRLRQCRLCQPHRGNRRVTLGNPTERTIDRKSTRLNSSHGSISYAVFCLKKKNTYKN